MCLRSGGETTDVEGRDYTAFALSIDEARRKRAEKDTKENPQQDICPRLQKKEEGICGRTGGKVLPIIAIFVTKGHLESDYSMK